MKGIYSLLISLLFCTNAMAAVEQCPTVEKIRAQKFVSVKNNPKYPQFWALMSDKFQDNGLEWALGISVFLSKKGETADQALADSQAYFDKANLSYPEAPMIVPGNSSQKTTIVCIYLRPVNPDQGPKEGVFMVSAMAAK